MTFRRVITAGAAAAVVALSAFGAAAHAQSKADFKFEKGTSAYLVTLKSVETRKSRKGGIVTVGAFAVTDVIGGKKIERVTLARPGRAPAYVKAGARGVVALSPAELAAIMDGDEDTDGGVTTNMLGGLIWFFTGIADAPTTPPDGVPGKPEDPIVPDEPPADDTPPDDSPDTPDNPGNPGGPGGPIGGWPGGDGDGIDNGVEFAEFLCGGLGEAGSVEVEECIGDMLDPSTTLGAGGPSDPEGGGFTGGDSGGGGDTGGGREDTGDTGY